MTFKAAAISPGAGAPVMSGIASAGGEPHQRAAAFAFVSRPIGPPQLVERPSRPTGLVVGERDDAFPAQFAVRTVRSLLDTFECLTGAPP
jgi:hypothetical protein